MSCYYPVGDIDFPQDRIFEVRSWLQENDLLDYFCITESDGHALLEQVEADMHSGCDLDPLFEMIAGWISGTPMDGQVVSWEYGSSTGIYILVGGKVETLESDAVILKCDAAPPPGEAANVTVTVRALGLPGNRVLVIGHPES